MAVFNKGDTVIAKDSVFQTVDIGDVGVINDVVSSRFGPFDPMFTVEFGGHNLCFLEHELEHEEKLTMR